MESVRSLLDALRSLLKSPVGDTLGAVAPPLPDWSVPDERPRVVIEHEDAVWQWAASGLLESAGYQVASCSGPHGLAQGRCPLVHDGACPLVAGADVVVNGLGIRDPANRAVLAAMRDRQPDLPVVVELPGPQRDRLDTELPGCQTVAFPLRPGDLLDAVDGAVGGPRPSA